MKSTILHLLAIKVKKIVSNGDIMNKSNIYQMTTESYQEFKNEHELNTIFGQTPSFQNILGYLADGYSLEQIIKFGINAKEIQAFKDYLASNNLTVPNAIAINQYSNGSGMILSLKNGACSKKDIQKGIMDDLSKKLMERRYSRYNCHKQFCSKLRLFNTFVPKLSNF